MKTKFAAIVAALAMIFGCFGTSTALAQAGKDIASKKEKKEGEKKIELGFGFEQQLVKVGPSVTMEEAFPKLVKGETTLEKVIELLGNPTHLNMNGDGGRMAMYMWRSELRTGKPNYGRLVGEVLKGPFAIIGSGRRFEATQQAVDEIRNSMKTLTATFSPDGILKDVLTNPYIPPAKQPAPPGVPKVTAPQDKAEKTEKTPDAPLVAATPSN